LQRGCKGIMKKQLVIVGILVLLVCVGFSGCTENNNITNADKNNFVGSWRNNTYMQGELWTSIPMDLFSNGSCTYNNVSGTWDIKDNKLVLTFVGYTVAYGFMFSDNYKILTLIYTSSTGDTPIVFTKQV
jgi:hypothetical protein